MNRLYLHLTQFLLKSTFIIILIFSFSCRDSFNTVEHNYHYTKPIYDYISLTFSPDSMHFMLSENTYNNIQSFNLFRERGIDYISFYDQRSESINIYYLLDQHLYKSITLKKFYKNKQLYKTSAYIKNWDSIFIINNSTLSLFDSSGHRKQRIKFPTEPINNAAIFDNNKQPIIVKDKLYAISRNRVNYRALKALREWKVMYIFDLNKGTLNLSYHLPLMYQKNIYGRPFLEYNFCYNANGKFVFNFPADTLLYETDLSNYNHSYFARSKEQKDNILPVDEKALGENQQSLKEYAIRDSYRSIFYDYAKKYYLRLARHKLSLNEFGTQKRQQQTVLILNEHFQIIGESAWPEGIDFDTLFCTPEGQLFARTNSKDEYALHFVRISYQANTDIARKVVKK